MSYTKVHINEHFDAALTGFEKEDRGRLGRPEIVVAKDHVLICGQCVIRPLSISPSQWMKYWERVQ